MKPFFSLLWPITLLLATASLTLAGDTPSPYESWFTDVEELDRDWITIHEDHRLPEYKRRFCAVRKSDSVAKTLGDNPTRDTLSMSNPPGTFNTGLCWMHSRLQRSAAYLAFFRPELPRPTQAEARSIIHSLARRERVIEIGGFRNLNEFSARFKDAFVSELDRMGVECFVNPTDCVARLGDASRPRAEELRGTLDALYDQMIQQPGQIQFIRIKPEFPSSGTVIMKLFGSHSLLVLKMEPLKDDTMVERPSWLRPLDGYRLTTIDSNFPDEVVTVDYRFGSRWLIWIGKKFAYVFAPYRHYEYAGDLNDFSDAVRDYCRR